MGVLLKNNARSVLATAVTSTATVIRVRVGHGDRFPQPQAAGDWFPLTLEDGDGNIEITRAISRSGDSITVQRGAEGTLPRSYSIGDAVELRLTSAALANEDTGGSTNPITVSISDGSLG